MKTGWANERLLPSHSHPRAGEDRRTHIDRRRFGDLDPRVRQVLDRREHFDAMAKTLGDISVELEVGIQRKLVQVVVKLTAGSTGLRRKSPAVRQGVERLQRELIRRNLRHLQPRRSGLGWKARDYRIHVLISGDEFEAVDPPSGVDLNAARPGLPQILALARDQRGSGAEGNVGYGVGDLHPEEARMNARGCEVVVHSCFAALQSLGLELRVGESENVAQTKRAIELIECRRAERLIPRARQGNAISGA